MDNNLYHRIYQRVLSETKNDEQFSSYLAEICADDNSHCDDLHDILDTMFKTSYPTVSETRRQNIVCSLLDMIETHREQLQNKKITENSQDDDDEIDAAETVERDGECKLCGATQRITSMIQILA